MKITPSTVRISSCTAIAIIITQLSFIQSFAQDFGRFKPGISWQQINTPVIRVIFPKGLESQANRVANDIGYLNANCRSTIGPWSKKLDLILSNRGVISNGYVTLMPYRSEFYTTPMQDGFALGTVPWLDFLSIHEYRHALQYINLRHGYTKLAWWLLGDAGWSSEINMNIPDWFLEGDAVATETALTNQGRGRLPQFLSLSKSILANGRKYSYMKARNGSYRDRVPDQYELGYLLCSYGRENFGNDLWAKVIRYDDLIKSIIYPFSHGLREYTGITTRKFYREALQNYDSLWSSESAMVTLTPARPVGKPTKIITDYRFPSFQPNGDLLVYKESFNAIGAIYRIDSAGKETRVCTTGLSLDPYFTASGNRLAWTEITWDKRYSSQSYSDVIIYQTDIRKKIYLTRKQRFFSPALSPDGSRIVVAEVDQSGNCRLKILDSRTGTITDTLSNPEKLFHTYPKWDTDGASIITSARTVSGSMLIVRQMTATGKIIKLTQEYNQVIGEVLVTPESLYFTSGDSGTNNIYCFSRSDGSVRQLTGSRFGAYYPAVSSDRKRLVYSDFRLRGYTLVSAPMDSLLWKRVKPVPLDQVKENNFTYFETEGGNILDRIPDEKMNVTPYRQWQHPIRIHSWSLSPSFYSIGLHLTSDNILSNLHIDGGLDYYLNESTLGFSANISYGGIYPVLSAGISRIYRHPGILEVLQGTETPMPVSVDNQLSLEAAIPLILNKGQFYNRADLSLGYDFISVKGLQTGTDSYNLSAIAGKAGFTHVQKKAIRNITTAFGLGLELTVNQSLGFTKAGQYQVIGDFATRGFFPNHNLVLTAGWQYELYRNPYHFLDLFLYPRGYSIPLYDRMLTLQSTYHFPLLYPDFGFWGIFYCSRIRATIFADYGAAIIPAEFKHLSNGKFASAGTELIFDTRWLNIASIPLGIRFSLLLSPDFSDPVRKYSLEFVIPVVRL